MRLCRDISNRGKHHTLERRWSVDANWSLRREWVPGSDGAHRWFLFADDQAYDPLKLVKECEKFWANLIADKKLAEPRNPFSR